MTDELRAQLPPGIPDTMTRLPLDHRGYPIPWFVAVLPDGSRDFRITDPIKIVQAAKEGLCWVCGEPLTSAFSAYVVGPMCAINRISSEPASHVACACWSAKACPFLSRPKAVRRTSGMENIPQGPVAGIMEERNPGVSLVWVTEAGPIPVQDGKGGILFRLGDAYQTYWYAEGRDATREEVMHSIDTGLPRLMELAEADGPEAVSEVSRLTVAVTRLLPAG